MRTRAAVLDGQLHRRKRVLSRLPGKGRRQSVWPAGIASPELTCCLHLSGSRKWQEHFVAAIVPGIPLPAARHLVTSSPATPFTTSARPGSWGW